MTTYTVTAERGTTGGWVLQCEEFPGAISETRALSNAHGLMQEAIGFVAEVDPAEVTIRLKPVLPAAVSDQLTAARQAVDDLARMQVETAERSRRAVRVLVEDFGYSGRDVAAVLEISPQRVSQLTASK